MRMPRGAPSEVHSVLMDFWLFVDKLAIILWVPKLQRTVLIGNDPNFKVIKYIIVDLGGIMSIGLKPRQRVSCLVLSSFLIHYIEFVLVKA